MKKASFLDRFFLRLPPWVRIVVILCFFIVLLSTELLPERDLPPLSPPPLPVRSASGGVSHATDRIRDAVSSQVAAILADTEVQRTLERIEQDRPRYRQDGAIFLNREKRLPLKKNRSYYHEWTVITPGAGDRGARRIIEGALGELYFTDDHYESFVRVQ